MTRLAAALALVILGCHEAAPPPDAGRDAPPELDAAPDAPPDAAAPVVPPEVDGRLVVNEFMAANAVTVVDATGAAGDWIELYNPTDVDLPLHGYGVTDDLAMPHKHVLGGIIVLARSRVLLWADGHPERGASHLGWSLDRGGGVLGLARPDGSYIDRVRYPELPVDFAAARTPDASDRWVVAWDATPRLANPAGPGLPIGREDPAAPPEQVPDAGDVSEALLGYDALPQLALLVSPDGVAALTAAPFVDVPATLVFRGRSYGPVGLRLKGQNSFLPFAAKPSLRINIDEYVPAARFWGLKDLTLNNMAGDLSMMHERLAYWVMRQAGIPAPRATHARLTINGQPYGLYTNVETVKRVMLTRWFADPGGSLFEATDVDLAPSYVASYELEAGPDDRSLIAGAAAALTNPVDVDAIAGAAAYVDLAQFQRFWAVCAVIGQFDSFPYSAPGDDYFVYADPSRGRLVFMPWGMDETFYSSQVDVVTSIASILARRCRAAPACFAGWVAQTREVLALTEAMDLAGERVRVMAQIAPFVAADTHKPYTDQEVATSQSALYWFIRERRTNLASMLPPP